MFDMSFCKRSQLRAIGTVIRYRLLLCLTAIVEGKGLSDEMNRMGHSYPRRTHVLPGYFILIQIITFGVMRGTTDLFVVSVLYRTKYGIYFSKPGEY